MRWLLTLWLASVSLLALDVVINSGKEEGRAFAVLNLTHDTLFPCKEELNRHSEVERVVCLLEGKPSTSFTQSQTLFFKISTEYRRDSLYLVITPLKRAKLFALHADSRNLKPLVEEQPTLSRRWQVIGYEEKLPFLSEQKARGINFPVSMETTLTPSIGALDLFKKPLYIESGHDVQPYLSAKALMERRSYADAIEAVDEALRNYPETIFKRDLLLFKIRALEAMKKPDDLEDIVALGKSWSRAYPSDSSVPEVLYILAKTYGGMQFFDEARYYYERLFSEHKGDDFELRARIALADELLGRGDSKRAPQLYTSALNDSQSLETASLAAVRLADYQVHKKNFKEAESLLLKVLEANPTFFQAEPVKNAAMIDQWVEEGFFGASARVAEAIWRGDLEDEALAEQLLYKAGVWFENAGEFVEAHRVYGIYKTKYPKQPSITDITARDDKLLFVLEENDLEKRLERLDYVIATYPNSPEEKRAYERKAETFMEQGKPLSVIEIERFLDKENPSLKAAASQLLKESLARQDCKEGAFYLQKYGAFGLEESERLQGFDCLVDSSLLSNAEALASEGIATENLALRVAWLYRYAQVLEAQQSFNRATLAARDTLMLADSLQKPEFKGVAFILFNALAKQDRQEEAREVWARLQREFPEDSRMIEVYKTMLAWASKRLDETAIEVYAKELMRLQALHQRPEFSPWVELTYIESLLRGQRFQEALALLEGLLKMNLTPEDRIKTLYIRGSIAPRVGDKNLAKESYEACVKIEAQSAWKNLCAESLKLLK